MELSILIVNYRTAGLLLDCLETVYRETRDLDFEVIVVDNASGDDSRVRVEAVYPQVRWIDMSYNSGFARANNEGIRQAHGKAVLLLNSDTLILEGAIQHCYYTFIVSDYVACGVQLLNADRTPQITGSYFMKGGLNHLLPLPFLGGLLKGMAGLLRVSRPSLPEISEAVEVDWINGAFLMVKKETIEKAGMLDEDFFLYAEEIEWCSRLRKQGRIVVYGQWHVIHLQGVSANETFQSSGQGYYNFYDRKGLQIMLSNFLRIRKQYGISWFFIQLAFYWLDVPVFFLGIPLSLLVGKRRYSYRQFWGFCKNIGFITRKSWTIIKNKPYFYKVL